MGFIIHFYITFGTNLLTGGPAHIAVLLPVSVFRRKGISNGVQTERNQLEKLFLEGNPPDGLGPHVRRYGRCSRGWRARLGGWARPLPRAFLVASLTYTPSPLDCFRSKNNSPEGFILFGLRLIFLFCETLKQGKNWHWALG